MFSCFIEVAVLYEMKNWGKGLEGSYFFWDILMEIIAPTRSGGGVY